MQIDPDDVPDLSEKYRVLVSEEEKLALARTITNNVSALPDPHGDKEANIGNIGLYVASANASSQKEDAVASTKKAGSGDTKDSTGLPNATKKLGNKLLREESRKPYETLKKEELSISLEIMKLRQSKEEELINANLEERRLGIEEKKLSIELMKAKLRVNELLEKKLRAELGEKFDQI